MRSGTVKIVEYREAVLRHIYICKAKAFHKEYHAKMLCKHLKRDDRSLSHQEVVFGYNEKNDQTDTEEEEEPGSFLSPELLQGEETEEATDPEEDQAILERKRLATLEEQKRRIQEALIVKDGDALFGSKDNLNLVSLLHWWHDRYRLRKPEYFNLVHTECPSNRYNRTHYDCDNPLQKVVKGYKFSMFYPDHIGTKTPTFTTEKDGCSADTCIIRFHAGPPYEDIAFQVVNRDWDSECTFERGTLHLNINSKIYFYRR